jgi:hypothetical protein
MTPVVLKLFTSQIQGSAPQPGPGTTHIVLSGVRAINGVSKGPNDAIFERASDGNVQLNLNNVSDEFAGLFKRGRVYKVTIEEESGDPQKTP